MKVGKSVSTRFICFLFAVEWTLNPWRKYRKMCETNIKKLLSAQSVESPDYDWNRSGVCLLSYGN